ncbi:MAG: hypothetical protein LBT16_01335 [Treponema sp.]|jgi:hypothetical protein|nr:hypothetical protein [Treponema sp.]
MAKDKAVYAPGELDKTRGRLGTLDPNEAKRLAHLLGGEVGVERSPDPPPPPPRTSRSGGGSRGSDGRKRSAPRHRVELAPDEDELDGEAKKLQKAYDAADNPTLPIKLSYRERVKMDKYMGQTEFEIKGPFQVLKSIFSIASPPPDYVSSRFVTKRLSEYYERIESLVTATRTLLPRNNIRRNEQLKRVSGFTYRIIDIFRYWDIEHINSELTRIQLHPRENQIPQLAEILKKIYKPIFLLEKMDFEAHIKEAYKLVYKIIYLENPNEKTNKHQELIKTALVSWNLIRKEIRYLLYPLLMKLLSDRWLSCEEFFANRRNRLMVFLGVSEAEQLLPSMAEPPKTDEDLKESLDENEDGQNEETEEENNEDNDTVSKEANDKKVVRENERKAVDRGLVTLETLFPKSGWTKAALEADFYPYFSDVFKLRKEYALISPLDGLQQVSILIRILEELFFALRSVTFGMINGPDGLENAGDALTPVINNWHYFINHLDKEYLPRLSEYCRILETAAESRTSNYAKRLLDELYWIKRQYFMPLFKFESSFPPPFQKGDVIALYPQVRALRKYLTAIAGGIEKGNKAGGAARRVPCDGIDNPWEPYIFQIPNPVSMRLDTLLRGNQKSNASLVFFTLAVVIVLDFIINNEESWGYYRDGGRPAALFRSVNDEGIVPQRGVDKEIDTEAILKEMVKKAKAQGA